MNNQTLKNLQIHPEEATPEQVRALAYLWPNTIDLLMLRSQQVRLLRQKAIDALDEAIASQERATGYARHIVGWALATAIATSFALTFAILYFLEKSS